jgi:protein DGCR14
MPTRATTDAATRARATTPTTSRADARSTDETSTAREAREASRAGGAAETRGVGTKRRRGGEEVLDEDEYTARLEAIIERDYFPDLRTNRLKATLLEATRRGDARAIAAAHREMHAERTRWMGSRGGVVGTPSIGGSGTTVGGAEASWETETPRRRNDFEDEEEYVNDDEEGVEGIRGYSTAYEEDRHLSVNGFLAKYTSEDNASFSEIVQRSEAKRALKKRYVEAVTAPPSRRTALLAALTSNSQPSSTLALLQGAEVAESDPSPTKPIAGVGHDSLYNAPDGVALSLKERQAMVVGICKAPIAANTRFVAPKPRTDGREGKHSTLKQYERVHTPSLTPGVDGSPIMTWGRIVSTPLRLEDTE